MDRLLLGLATLIFLTNLLLVAGELRRGVFRVTRRSMVIMGVGFVVLTAVLYLRGQLQGRCPLTSPFEILVFLSWSVVLWYFVFGPSFRLSLLGIFTTPVVVVLLVIALLPGVYTDEHVPARVMPLDFWLELHAALALLSYGGLGLAAIAGVMFLVQDYQLKHHQHSSLFFHLPPVNHLFRSMVRLVAMGTLLMALSMALAYLTPNLPHTGKLVVSYAIFAWFTAILLLRWRGIPHRLLAQGTAFGFVLATLSIWMLTR